MLCDFVNKDMMLYLDIHRPISVELGMDKKPLNSTFWYQFGWPWPAFKITVVENIKTSVAIFLEIYQLIWMKFCV